MKETFDYRDKMAITRAIADYRRGRISRRTMVKTLAAAGVALTSGPMRGVRSFAAPARQEMTADQQPEEINAFLQDVGGQFSGASIKVVSEETPPSRAIINLKAALFEELTGITVNWEVVPLDQVLAKVSQDAATQAGANATQAATHAGTWSTMLAGGVGLVVGMFLALTISATR